MIVLMFIIPVLVGIVSAGFIAGTHRHKVLIYCMCGLLPDILAAAVLYLLMGRYDLFEASDRFRLIFCVFASLIALMPPALAVVCPWCRRMIESDSLIAHISCAFFLALTYLLYVPCVILISNNDDFMVKMIDAVILFGIVALTAFVILVIVRLILARWKVCADIYGDVIFLIGLCIYIQYNFLNHGMPVLTGETVDWIRYRPQMVIGVIVWLVCIMIVILIHIRVDRIKRGKVLLALSVSLSLMQLVSLCFVFRGYYTSLSGRESSSYTRDGEYDLGGQTNVVIFIVDTLDVEHMRYYLASDLYKGELSDYDYFDNVIAGGAPTILGGAAFLSGIEYDPAFSFSDYQSYVSAHNVLSDFREHDYDVRIFSNGTLGQYECENVCGLDDNTIDNKPGFIRKMNKLVGYSVLPYVCKPLLYGGTEEITGVLSEGTMRFNDSNSLWYEDLKRIGELNLSFDRAFRLYHLYGMHTPYHNDESCNRIDLEENAVNANRVLAGIFREITTYTDMLKELGVYDRTTVVIMGDHGSSAYGLMQSRPAVLVKLDHEHEGLRDDCGCMKGCDGVSALIDTPLSFWNLTNLLRALAGDDAYGMTMYDSLCSGNPVRRHTRYNETDYTRVRVLTDGSLEPYDSLSGEYIEVRIGEPHTISDTEVAPEVSYEMQLNLALDDSYDGGDLTFTAHFSQVYGDKQQIIVFIGNSVIETIELHGGVAGEYSFKVPSACISEGTLNIRQVYPDAVLVSDGNVDRVASVTYDSILLE